MASSKLTGPCPTPEVDGTEDGVLNADGDEEMEEGHDSVTDSILDSNEEDEVDPTPPLQPAKIAPQEGSVPKEKITEIDLRKGSISSQMSKARLTSDNDSVFCDNTMAPPPPKSNAGGPGPYGLPPGAVRVESLDSFPPIYNIIKANKKRAMAAQRLDSNPIYPRVDVEDGSTMGGGGGFMV